MEGNEASRGVNYRALEALFAVREDRRDSSSYTISVSMLEIYNEAINDMLAERPAAGSGGRGGEATKVVLREGPQGVFVQDLTVKPVEGLEDVLRLMKQGYRNRTTFATNMNEHSSRSHCMLSVYVAGVNRVTGAAVKGKLHLVDLAGSERVSKSGVTGDRLKEAQNINKSLSALGDVIQARMEKRGHVPFRNSTLTWLLSDSLSGDSKTLMFVNLSPISSNAEETVCSLNFASRARNVELGRAAKHVTAGAGAGGAAKMLTAGAGTPGRGAADVDDASSADGDWLGDGASHDGAGSVDGDAVAAATPAAATPGSGTPAARPGVAGGAAGRSSAAAAGVPPSPSSGARAPLSGPGGGVPAGSAARRMLGAAAPSSTTRR
jgi:kinesin family protein C2/C3